MRENIVFQRFFQQNVFSYKNFVAIKFMHFTTLIGLLNFENNNELKNLLKKKLDWVIKFNVNVELLK